jgi:hypothetical protein
MRKTAYATILILALLLSGAELVKMAEANFMWIFANVEPVPGTIPPSISIHKPQNNTSYSSNTVTLNFSVRTAELNGWSSFITNVEYSLDGSNLIPVAVGSDELELFDTALNLTLLSSGKHSLTVTADVVVYRSEPLEKFFVYTNSTVFFTAVDVNAPVISSLSVVNKTYSQNDLPLNFTVDESTSWMGYSLDGSTNVTVTGNSTFSKLASGSHTLTVYANDTSGNMGASETIYFTVAETFPTALVATASGVSVAAIGLGLLVYFKKRKH